MDRIGRHASTRQAHEVLQIKRSICFNGARHGGAGPSRTSNKADNLDAFALGLSAFPRAHAAKAILPKPELAAAVLVKIALRQIIFLASLGCRCDS
jgi:hypothetical protein